MRAKRCSTLPEQEMKRSPGSSRPCTRRWRLRSSSQEQTKSCRATSSSSRPWPRAASSRTAGAPPHRPEELPETSKAAPKHREAPGPQPGRMQKSPSGGLANARQGRVAVAQEGQLRWAPRTGAKLGAALRFFSLSFSAACLISSVLGVSGPRCFEEHGEGAEGLLGALCRCRELEDGAEKVDVCLKAESPQPPLQKTYVAGAVAEAETVE